MKKTSLFRLFVSLLVLLLLVSLFPACVSAVNSSKADYIEKDNDLLQKYEDEAIIKYNKLIIEWANNQSYPSDDDMTPPDYYAGAYINGERHLTIQATVTNDYVKEELGKIIDLKDVSFELVPRSLCELRTIKDIVEQKLLADSKMKKNYGITGVGISFYRNAVCIYASNGEEKDIINQLKPIVSADSIVVVKTTAEDTPCATAYPGTQITSSPASGYRSLGFWAYSSSGVLGFVTAPHSEIQFGNTIFCNGTTAGTAGTPYYSGNVDCVFIYRTNASVTPSRYVGNGFSLASGASISPTVGATTYSSGITTGYATGTITDIYYSTSYGISNCIVSSAPCAPGDSGGPVASGGNYSTRYLLGIVTGRTASNYQITVRVSNILSKLNATIY